MRSFTQLLLLLFLTTSHALLAQYTDVSGSKAWNVDDPVSYTGLYLMDYQGTDRDYLVMISEGEVVVQSREGEYTGNPNAPYDEQYWQETIVNYAAKQSGNKLSIGKDSWEFIMLSDGTLGLLKGEVFMRKKDDMSGYFPGTFSQASNRILAGSEIIFLPVDKLQIMRNEIFARYGYTFKSGGKMEAHFKTQKWYKPKSSYNDNMLHSIEKKNIELIRMIETAKKEGKVPKFTSVVSGKASDFSESRQQELSDLWSRADQIEQQLSSEERGWDDLSTEEQELASMTFDSPSPMPRSVFEIRDPNPDWDASYEVKASSTLQGSKEGAYDVSNSRDFDLRTAWVEGVEGDGIGEKITYTFDYPAGYWTGLLIHNGYGKSESVWAANNRIKTLRVSIEDKALFDVELSDTRVEQLVPMYYYMAEEFSGSFSISFEIREVYPGTKYKDTCISELILMGSP